ncbi:putative transcription factor TCP family [Lupinus albus]|uniref:Putative transcription factor TCP family n=1 Tax=Lupinus albus TaxID=3870 RepID=A0A6A4Q829_LUPAL|nr:putative transcription factor TCP family [Lupinus albus]
MYSSNSPINGNDLIPYPIHFCSSGPFYIESNPSSTQETTTSAFPSPPLSFFQFKYDPFEDHEILLEQQQCHDFLHQQQSLADDETVNVNMENNTIILDHKAGQGTDPQIPIRRFSKRDRHSKINTAKGMRDRRMRLSLLVAKRFFGLQDMLGFDKASKTVDWLLNQAKVEIEQLAREKNIHHHYDVKSASSTSECTEAVSSLDEVAVIGNQEQVKGVTKVRRAKLCKKSEFKHVCKESREKARERARERTQKKIKTGDQMLAEADESKECNKASNNNLNSLGSWNPFETVEECAYTQIQSVNPSLDVLTHGIKERSSQAKGHLGSVEDIEHEDSLVTMSIWNPTMIFNYSLCNSGIFQEVIKFKLVTPNFKCIHQIH